MLIRGRGLVVEMHGSSEETSEEVLRVEWHLCGELNRNCSDKVVGQAYHKM